jgi:hypothetical protein
MATRQRGDLAPEAFEQLLRALDPDRETAGQQYLSIRRQLADYFAWQACENPDELADLSLNRLARKLAEGEIIQSLERFAFGIARMVVREDRRSRATRENVLRSLRVPAAGLERESAGIAMMQECIAALDHQSRDLITSYYTEEDRTALRIREKLFACFMQQQRDIT